MASTVEWLVRGFSNTFTPEAKTEPVNLEFIENKELDRTWKTTRRQRLKEQEQKIWNDFVKEQDVLKSVCSEDPYQFLEQLPEDCLKELMDFELNKMKKEKEEEEARRIPVQSTASRHPLPSVTLSSTAEDDTNFYIYSDSKDSGGEEDQALDLTQGDRDDDEASTARDTPRTVRERIPPPTTSAVPPSAGLSVVPEPPTPPPPPPVSRRSPSKNASGDDLNQSDGRSINEHIANIVESNINCTKVKEMRIKLIEEVKTLKSVLELQGVSELEPMELARTTKRSAEFCGRFQRIYLYQLQRQMHDIKRHAAASLPFAKYTAYQSQMARIAALHHTLLQAFQVFHKSVEAPGAIRGAGAALRALAAAARRGTRLLAATPPPNAPSKEDFADQVYGDELRAALDALEAELTSLEEKTEASYIAFDVERSGSISKRSSKSKKSDKSKFKKKNVGAIKTTADCRLSMYSLDARLVAAACSSKDMNPSGGTSKARLGPSMEARAMERGRKRAAVLAKNASARSRKKSPRSARRPLMRDPHEGRARAPPRDTDIQTMVEVMDAASSQVSGDPTPRLDLRHIYSKAFISNATPRPPTQPATSQRGGLTARKLTAAPEPLPLGALSPTAPASPKLDLKPTLSSVKNGSQEAREPVLTPMSVHITTKDHPETKGKTPRDSPRVDKLKLPSSAKKNTDKAKQEAATREAAASSEVTMTRLLQQLCGGDSPGRVEHNRVEHSAGPKNAQLITVGGAPSPRGQSKTPQLLKILEKTIQKVPKSMQSKQKSKDPEKCRLAFNIPDPVSERLFKYRTKFVQHMLASPLYANSTVGKPWEMITTVAEEIIEELLRKCAQEIQLDDLVKELYAVETQY